MRHMRPSAGRHLLIVVVMLRMKSSQRHEKTIVTRTDILKSPLHLSLEGLQIYMPALASALAFYPGFRSLLIITRNSPKTLPINGRAAVTQDRIKENAYPSRQA